MFWIAGVCDHLLLTLIKPDNMKNTIVFIILSVLTLSCEKEKTEVKDYSGFLARDFSSFYGNIGNDAFAWHLVLFEPFQKMILIEYPTESSLLKDYETAISSGIISENSNKSILLYLPKIDLSNELEFNEILSPGVKTLGDKYSDFHFKYHKDNNSFETSSLGKFNKLEILKTEKYYDELSDSSIRIWVAMSGDLSPVIGPSDSIIRMTEGLFVADFYTFRRLNSYYDDHINKD